MDAHAFRIVGRELVTLLSGARIEKIHSPVQDFLVFAVFSNGRKWRFGFSFDRLKPSFFILDLTLANPATPPNFVMRLRKYLAGHKLGQGILDFASRQIIFPITCLGEYKFLLLELGQMPSLLKALPDNFPNPVTWPLQEEIADFFTTNKAALNSPKQDVETPLWKKYPVLTPQLRETLNGLDLPDALALLVDLEAGGEELFFYFDQSGHIADYAAWPFPDKVLAGKGLVELSLGNTLEELPQKPSMFELAPNFSLTSIIDQDEFAKKMGLVACQKSSKPVRQENKKLSRLLRTLEQEELRLQGLLALRREACAIQGVLWQFSVDEKRSELFIEEDGKIRRITLDPRLTVRENMAYMFKQSQRGARGLAILEQRKAGVAAELARQENLEINANTVQNSAIPMELKSHNSSIPIDFKVQKKAASVYPATKSRDNQPVLQSKAGESFARVAQKSTHDLKEVQEFKSSEGYIILRGKSAKGNQRLLKIGQPYDLWLHSKDGPSAHAIIRRAHSADEVPQETLEQAAVLVGQKSWQRDDSKAEVMVAMLGHVHSVKGAAAGAVRVDKILQTLVVNLTPNSGV